MRTRYKWSNKDKLFSMIESDEKADTKYREERSAPGTALCRCRFDYPETDLPDLYYGQAGRVDILLEKVLDQ